jgi:AraC family L-rhamnose operon regulatory protein RhaS
MKLYTECHSDGWDRIVDIYTEKADSLPAYINDDSTYKIIILEKGILEINSSGETCEVKAPALISLAQDDVLDCRIVKSIKAYIIFFKPSVIRDEFTFDRIDSGEFAGTTGQSIFQDYILIRPFRFDKNICRKVIPLPLNGLKRLKELFTVMDKQLRGQRDGFWPCRSRSYLMEILHFIIYSYVEVSPETLEDPEQEEFSKITEYLNEHLADQITLETLTKKFAINRNKLNDLFMKQASMTCLNYLLNLRMDLAKILLTKTELPINEIGSRVGFPDPNYFAKIFKHVTGKTPSLYRKN